MPLAESLCEDQIGQGVEHLVCGLGLGRIQRNRDFLGTVIEGIEASVPTTIV